MNPLIQPKTITSPLLITLTLLCIGLLPNAEAVVPPPDGGYPGFNTAEGQNALFSLTTATGNVAVGWASLYTDAEGNFNTAIGTGALLFNPAEQCSKEPRRRWRRLIRTKKMEGQEPVK
jgi:hypothetical protein